MMEADKVQGFENLNTQNANMFRSFLKNFYSGQGTASQKTFIPSKVTATWDKGSGQYLRFDYEINGHKCWLHVTGPWTWF